MSILKLQNIDFGQHDPPRDNWVLLGFSEVSSISYLTISGETGIS